MLPMDEGTLKCTECGGKTSRVAPQVCTKCLPNYKPKPPLYVSEKEKPVRKYGR